MAERTEGLQDQQHSLPPPAQSPVPLPAAATPLTAQSGQHQNYPQGYHGKPYNKHNAQTHGGNAAHAAHGGNAPHTGSSASGHANHNGQRQNYQGSQNKYYNKRNNYNQKINNNSNNQFSGYPYPPSVYAGAYYFPYPYAQGMVPGMSGIPNYNPQLPQQMHTPLQQYPAVSSPGASKVKITDKDGKQVDLDEKTKVSALSLASTTPVPVHAQTVSTGGSSESVTSHAAGAASTSPASSSPTLASPASAPAASASGKVAAAEEFRRKILEKAKAAQKKKDEEKAAAAAAAQQKVAATAPVVESKTPETPAESKVETPVETKKEEPTPVAKEESVEIKAPVEASQAAEETASESVKPIEATQPEDTVKAVEPIESVEEKAEPTEPSKAAEPAEPVEQKVEPTETAKTAEPTEPVEKTEVETSADTTGVEDTTIAEEDNDDEDENDEDDEDDESVFDLSLYFARLSTAKPIEDPFSFNYPYPLTGVDSRWKQGQKQYRYDPQFLLQFKDIVQYPIDDAWKEKLEGLGIVPTKRSASGPQRMNSNKFGNQMQGRFNGSMSGRSGQFEGRQNSRTGSKRRGGSNAGGPRERSTRNRNQSKRGKGDDEPPKPAEDVKPLVPSANRWVPRSRTKTEEVKTAPDGSIILETEDIERKVKSALNKLTLEMFEPITEDLLTIAKQSRWEEDAKTIKQVISLTFAKACDEPYWSSVYAQFCAKMLKEIPEEIKDVNTLTKTGEPAAGGDLARRLLLATCQVEYEKGWVDKLPTNPDGTPLEPEMMSDEYYAMAAAKRRGLGLVKFIGNLYILNMLNDQVILHCLRDQSKNVVDPSEDSLENLTQLIKTVGPRFEATERNRAALNMIFDNIQQILENSKLSSRIKFMLMDLQDLKKSNWKAAKQEAGPKTIKEIHNEAELKRIEDSRAQAEKRRSNKSNYNSGNYGGGDSRSNSTRGGSSWGNKKDSRAPTKDSRGFTAVPRSQSNRPTEPSVAASTMSPRENSKRTDSMASNIFAALDGEHDDEESENTGH